VTGEPPIRAGAVAPVIASEIGRVALKWCAFAVPANPLRRSPPALRERLRALSDRHRGAQAIALRTRAIPHAYRVLYRHLGMEPDVRRIPVEALIVERLTHGAFPSRGMLPDALAVATVETEVAVWAVDGERLSGEPRLDVVDGRVAVADDGGRIAELFALPDEPRAVTRDTRSLVLYAVAAPGVPDIAVEEALWTAWDLLAFP
jgi:DNA/RNA-binding domain of Phe-tRNA-synthetase-like protein